MVRCQEFVSQWVSSVLVVEVVGPFRGTADWEIIRPPRALLSDNDAILVGF